MAKVEITVCDRCGKEVKPEGSDRPLRLTRCDKDYHGTKVDLCVGCAKAFLTWLDDPSSAPPGYEWKIRPCPHHIPCAEPWGCSGKELVATRA